MLPGETVKEPAGISRVLLHTQATTGRMDATTEGMLGAALFMMGVIRTAGTTVGWIDQTAGLVTVTVVLWGYLARAERLVKEVEVEEVTRDGWLHTS